MLVFSVMVILCYEVNIVMCSFVLHQFESWGRGVGVVFNDIIMVSVRTFSVMNDYALFFLCNHQNRHQATSKMAIILVNATGHYSFPQGLLWVCIGSHTGTLSLLISWRTGESLYKFPMMVDMAGTIGFTCCTLLLCCGYKQYLR